MFLNLRVDVLVGLIVVAGYVIGKRYGALIALLLLATPGGLATIGIWPNVNFLPDAFVIGGTGTLGSEWGMLPLLCMGLATGWSLIVILSDVFNLEDRFRHYFDHLWYSAAILAGIFFVADSRSSDDVRRLQEANLSVRDAGSYLLRQVITYEQWCRKNPHFHRGSCSWASDIQPTLVDYSTIDQRVFPHIGPKSSAELYGPIKRDLSPDQVINIRAELKSYNESFCPTKELGNGVRQFSRPSSTCQTPPAIFCSVFPDPVKGTVNKYDAFVPTAIATECIIPSLVELRNRHEKLAKIVSENSRAKHFRWLFFVLFSVVAGGKVANATVRAISLNKRIPSEQRRSIQLLRLTWSLVASRFKATSGIFGQIFKYAWNKLQRIVCAMRRLLKSRRNETAASDS